MQLGYWNLVAERLKKSPVIVAPSCYRGVANPVEANQKKKKQRIRTTKQTNGMNGNLFEIHRKQ